MATRPRVPCSRTRPEVVQPFLYLCRRHDGGVAEMQAEQADGVRARPPSSSPTPTGQSLRGSTASGMAPNCGMSLIASVSRDVTGVDALVRSIRFSVEQGDSPAPGPHSCPCGMEPSHSSSAAQCHSQSGPGRPSWLGRSTRPFAQSRVCHADSPRGAQGKSFRRTPSATCVGATKSTPKAHTASQL